MLRYTMNTQENPRINRQERRTDHVPWICLPQEDLPAVHSHYTHRSSTLPEGPLGGLPSLSLTTEGSWIHLGGGSTNLLSARWRQYPRSLFKSLSNTTSTLSKTETVQNWDGRQIWQLNYLKQSTGILLWSKCLPCRFFPLFHCRDLSL